MTPLYLVTDTETTGLDRYNDHVYEIAMTAITPVSVVFRYHAWIALPTGQPVSQYTLDSPNYQKYLAYRGQEGELNYDSIYTPCSVAAEGIEKRIKTAQERVFTNGIHTYLVGSNPSFDKYFIGRSLKLDLDAT